MRKTAFALVLAFFGGCCCGRTGSLPAVWIIPEVKIRLQWDPSPGDPLLVRVGEICRAMNRKLYDALDGQARIESFGVYRPDAIGEKDPGVGNLYRPGTQCPTCRDHASTAGRPGAPLWFHASLHDTDATLDVRANVMLHEFLHAWTGLEDEYRKSDGSPARCPRTVAGELRWDACIMSDGFHRSELCRAENHDRSNEQDETRGMSCYAWVQKAAREGGVALIKVPGDHLAGPDDPPEADVDFRL